MSLVLLIPGTISSRASVRFSARTGSWRKTHLDRKATSRSAQGRTMFADKLFCRRNSKTRSALRSKRDRILYRLRQNPRLLWPMAYLILCMEKRQAAR